MIQCGLDDIESNGGAAATVVDQPTRAGLRGLSILVLEAANHSRDALSLLLRAAGARVATARDGQEALRTMAEREFEVLLADVDVPGLPADGGSRRLRDQLPGRPKVVAVTGATPDEASGRQAGADIVLEKPFMFEELMAVLMPLAQPALGRPRSGAFAPAFAGN